MSLNSFHSDLTFVRSRLIFLRSPLGSAFIWSFVSSVSSTSLTLFFFCDFCWHTCYAAFRDLLVRLPGAILFFCWDYYLPTCYCELVIPWVRLSPVSFFLCCFSSSLVRVYAGLQFFDWVDDSSGWGYYSVYFFSWSCSVIAVGAFALVFLGRHCGWSCLSCALSPFFLGWEFTLCIESTWL